MKFNVRQQNAINSTAKHILCLASAASGKTSVLVARVERLLNQGHDPEKMVCFTFTNQAACEMKKRLGNKSEKMFIGTAHSYANHICHLNLVDTVEDILQEKFDNIITKALEIDKTNYPEVEYLFVDEFQDTDELQFNFITKINAENNYFCGDERQFIYSFKGTSDAYIRNLAHNPAFKIYNLTQNYRCPPNIMKYADGYVSNMNKISPQSEAVKKENGYLELNALYDEVMEELTWPENQDKLNEWAIICRTNGEVETVAQDLEEKEIPHVVIRKGDLELDEMNEILQENSVNIMTIHQSKGLEFNNVMVIGAKRHTEDERRISYVAATRAKENLFWCKCLKKAKVKKAQYRSEHMKKNNMITF